MSIGRVPGATGIQPSIVDAKGDLIVATAADSVSRLAVGTNNQVLMADSAQATGLKYANEATATLTAKGDILTATAANTISRLAVGSNDQVLTADSTTSTGLKWVTLAAGAYTSIATGTLSGASTTISSIPGTYTDLYLIVVNAYPATTGRTISVQMNGDTTASRHTQATYSANSGTATFNSTRWNAAILSDNNNTSNDGIATLRLYNYANTTTWKIGEWRSVNNYSADTTRPNYSTGLGMYNQTGAITSIKIFDSDGGNLGGGTYTLYGVK